MSSIRLTIAGEPTLFEGRYVCSLLEHLHVPQDGRGIAIAVNDVVVPKSRWSEHELREGDHIEIVKAVQGG